MKKWNLARLFQFLHLDTHLIIVKSDCSGFDVVTVVNLIKNWT